MTSDDTHLEVEQEVDDLDVADAAGQVERGLAGHVAGVQVEREVVLVLPALVLEGLQQLPGVMIRRQL